MNNFENILVEVEGSTALIFINRASKLNALNRKTLLEIQDAVMEMQADESIRGMILSGVGDKAFAAGADIAEFVGLSNDEGQLLSSSGHEVMNSLYNCPKPIIAAINGFALGGGLELAMACHLRIASDTAKVGLPEVSLGIIPGYGGTQRLTELVGRGKALEMILTGDMINAADAHQIGLVNRVVAQSSLLETCRDLLNKMSTRSRKAIAQAIQIVNAGLDKDSNGYQMEIDSFGNSFESSDFAEGVSAFLEKRKPNF